jgi:hypothetical protein
MSRTSYFISPRLAFSTLIATAAALGLLGCATVTTAPADTTLAGHWSRDKAASDNVDAKVAASVATAQANLRRRLNRYGYGNPQAGGSPGANGDTAPGETDAPDESFDTPGDRYGGPGLLGPDFRGLRARLLQALRSPAELQIEVQGDLVRLADDHLPPRDYRLGERISRLDEYGTAIINASWSHQAFVLRSSYTSHASRKERYEVDPATGRLTLTQNIDDPYIGKISLHIVYRRS